jgi:protocatechuate 3,4-dioxygenase, alpha subunit
MDNQSEELFGQTPWQTVGPFFHYGLPWKGGADLTGMSELGARPELFAPEHYLLRTPSPRGPIEGVAIEIFGRVLDGDGAAVPDALVEIWQANARGHYYAPGTGQNFIGFGRAATGNDGGYRFRTILPGRVPGPGNSLQAPHIAVGVMARGLLKRLATRLYFPEGEGLENDPILELVPPARRATLMARKESGGYRFDIVLQGAGETVFFDC